MKEIKVGQEWRENKDGRRIGMVDEIEITEDLEPLIVRLRITGARYGQPRDRTTVKVGQLLRGWTLTKETPDAPLRRIALPLAADTTATECCGCSMLDEYEYGGIGCCHAFEDKSPPNPGGIRQRLPECVAAEVTP